MQLPSFIGKYELIEFLGGGMSEVYRGRDTVIDRPVVVKLLTVAASSDSEAKARFLQEARVAGKIQHENIVRVFDFGEHEGRPFIVMEYLNGVDLRVALSNGTLRDAANGGLRLCLSIGLQIATALDYIHALGVVHRDIKPENVNLDSSGRAKLMDFGIAKTADLSLTRTGIAMGTPYYMAPQQVSGQLATPLVDIYAWGMLMFELLTGLRGVTGGTMESVFYQILNQPLDETVMEKAGVPREIRALVMQATAKDSAARLQSFGPAIATLKSFLAADDPAPVQPAPMPQAAKQRLPRVQESPVRPIVRLSIFVYAAVIVTTLIAVFIWYRMRPSQGDGKSGTSVETVDTQKGIPILAGMTYVPAGSFLAGSDKRPVELKAFYIDQTEVTAGVYCAAMHCDKIPAMPDLPMVNVTIAQARLFSMRIGKRLPTPLEWERAARGVNGNLYPWGDDADPTRANVADNPSFGGRQLVAVKSFQPYPEYQMVGNAWEIVEGPVEPSPEAVAHFAVLLNPPPTAAEPWVTARGGSFRQPLSSNIVWDSLSIPERFSAPDVGFRCVKDP